MKNDTRSTRRDSGARSANAHLVAAAPDLLASCRELRDALAAAMRVIAVCDQQDATCFF